MLKHKSEDYKLSAVKYYLNNEASLDDVCKIFDCPKQSLELWNIYFYIKYIFLNL